MYRCGFVSTEHVVDAIYQSTFKRQNSAKKNYQRMVYESIENDKSLQFGDLLDIEMDKLKEVM